MTAARTVGRVAGAALALAALAGTGAGCQERVCRSGEHVVRSTQAPDTGRTCVKDGEPPPPGYEEFPPGEAPVHVGDENDR